MPPKLTRARFKILKALVSIYSRKSEAVRGEEIAELVNVAPATVRFHMQVLKALGLVEGVPGAKGGYRPTYKAYEVLSSRKSHKNDAKVFVNGEEMDIKIKEVRLASLSNPNAEKAVIRLEQEAGLSKGDRISIRTESLAIEGRVSGFGDGGVVVDVEKVITYPAKTVGSLASPFASIDARLTIREAAITLSRLGVRYGLVRENGKALGVLTPECIAKAVAEGKLECKVGEMCTEIVVVDGKTPVGEAFRQLNRSGVLVVGKRKFKGIVSEKDLLMCLLEQ